MMDLSYFVRDLREIEKQNEQGDIVCSCSGFYGKKGTFMRGVGATRQKAKENFLEMIRQYLSLGGE